MYQQLRKVICDYVVSQKPTPGVYTLQFPVTNESLYFAKAGNNEHWITLKPHGDDSEHYARVLVRVHQDGSAHVISGGKGSKGLRGLKLSRLKSPKEWEQSAKKRKEEKKAKREAEKLKAKEDKGFAAELEARQRQEKTEREEKRARKIELVEKTKDKYKKQAELAKELGLGGWEGLSEAEKAIDELEEKEGVTSKEVEKLKLQHQRTVKASLKTVKKNLMSELSEDFELRQEILDDPTEPIQGEKLKGGKGFGSNPLSEEQKKDIEGKVASIHGRQTSAIEEKLATQQKLEKLKTSIPTPSLDTALSPQELKDRSEKVKKFLMLNKEIEGLEQSLKKFNNDVPKESLEPATFELDINKIALPDDIKQEVKELEKLDTTRSFFEEINKFAEGGSIEETKQAMLKIHKHSANTQLNNTLVATLGGGELDRQVMEVLGIEAATSLMANHMKGTLEANKLEGITAALRVTHDGMVTNAMEEAMKKSAKAKQLADAIEVPIATDQDSLNVAKQLTAQKGMYIKEGLDSLAHALGQMEASAALNQALRQPAKNGLLVKHGVGANVEGILKGLHLLGLEESDFQVTKDEETGAVRTKITKEGMDKLITTKSLKQLAHEKRIEGIQAGHYDEEAYIPEGFAKYPSNIHNDVEYTGPNSLKTPLDLNQGLEKGLEDYIASRVAEGWKASDITHSLANTEFINRTIPEESREKFFGELSKYFPTGVDIDTNQQVQGELTKLAGDWAKGEGKENVSLHTQSLLGDEETTRKAAYLSVANDLRLRSAFNKTLTNQDRDNIRSYYQDNLAGDTKGQKEALKIALGTLREEPEKYGVNLFGEESITPEWQEWEGKRQETMLKHAPSKEWKEFVQTLGGAKKAYGAIQEHMKGVFLRDFLKYNANLTGKQTTRVGVQTSPHGNLLEAAINPEKREALAKEKQKRLATLREREQGKFAEGAVVDQLEEHLAKERMLDQQQIGLFSSGNTEKQKQIHNMLQERVTLGTRAEGELQAMLPHLTNLSSKQKGFSVVPNMSMSGKYVDQQRAIKFAKENDKSLLAMGTGSGKTPTMLGLFSELNSEGKAKKGLFLTPPAVRDQMGSEAAKFFEPNQYKWHALEASNQERMQSYQDNNTDFHVVTHDGFANDLTKLLKPQYDPGGHLTENDFKDSFLTMKPENRRGLIQEVLKANNLSSLLDFVAIDEAHQISERAGKTPSFRNVLLSSFFQTANRGVLSSATAVKNDASEMHDLLSKLDHDQYEGKKEKFMRNYGVDIPVGKEALRNKVNHYIYTASIPSGAKRRDIWGKEGKPISLTKAQNKELKAIDVAYQRARQSKKEGQVNLKEIKALSPSSFVNHEGNELALGEQHQVASRLSDSLGILREAAHNREIHNAPLERNAKLQHLVSLTNEKKGQAGVVFASNLASVDNIAKALESQGHKVITLTGKHGGTEKSNRLNAFVNREADIIITSDASEAGVNLQEGQYLVNFNLPYTNKTYVQRNGRIDRIGQDKSIEIHNLVSDTDFDKRAIKRLEHKEDLQDFFEDATPDERFLVRGSGLG